jgi:hypothetical protein
MSDELVQHACRFCMTPLPSADAECPCGGRPWESRYTLDEVRAAFDAITLEGEDAREHMWRGMLANLRPKGDG